MRKLALALTAAVGALTIGAPAQSAVLLVNTSGITPTAMPAGTQGTLLASQSFTGTANTFAATFNQAVYLNTLGTLDFYYQVIRTGAGLASSNEISAFTVANFDSYLVDGFANALDPDGSGAFVAANNPALANGTLSGSTTTFGRSPDGNVLTTDFGANGLTGTENSATYIFRTNATAYNNLGFFGVIDGSTLQGRTYMPTSAVPEPATWAMMLVGFGAVGFGMRRRRNSNVPRTQAA